MMNTTDFEASLASEGYDEVLTREMEPGKYIGEHDHPFDARIMVLDGEISLTVDGDVTIYREGDTCTMAAGRRHVEAVGPEGVKLLIGRRQPA